MNEICLICKDRVSGIFATIISGATLMCPNCKSFYHAKCAEKKGLVIKTPHCSVCDTKLIKI
ncbi:MAG: hypothetical protein Sv326_0479 [Candidatus Fermentimicrarchaeum limneticum]|uniref:PHD-type domain-containing protein n=1 Tax=Fermentimicrarchaeum limneticum TaxID=2795018 RepID=A0A7D5XHU7_FERL1|nr:MAG: hypothetical protein Sv326_0479 [Candidatus Fermentimicrarchaeum limneticum]